MKVIRMTSIAGILFLVGAVVPVFPKPDQRGEGQSKSAGKGQGGPEKGRRGRERGGPPQQQHDRQRPGRWRANNSWSHSRANRWSFDHRNWAQRGGYDGHYIPQDAFRRHFGGQHVFRFHSRPVMYYGYPRFHYAGFSFLLLDPWPEYWDEDWYASDDLYIVYDDGYYLCNTRYPQVQLAISVLM